MTALDLAAVCERHDISTDRDPFCLEPHVWEAWFVGSYAESSITGPTEADAVCALLKARWGIVTERRESPNILFWMAVSTRGIASGSTELSAVVAASDRAAGVLP